MSRPSCSVLSTVEACFQTGNLTSLRKVYPRLFVFTDGLPDVDRTTAMALLGTCMDVEAWSSLRTRVSVTPLPQPNMLVTPAAAPVSADEQRQREQQQWAGFKRSVYRQIQSDIMHHQFMLRHGQTNAESHFKFRLPYNMRQPDAVARRAQRTMLKRLHAQGWTSSLDKCHEDSVLLMQRLVASVTEEEYLLYARWAEEQCEGEQLPEEASDEVRLPERIWTPAEILHRDEFGFGPAKQQLAWRIWRETTATKHPDDIKARVQLYEQVIRMLLPEDGSQCPLEDIQQLALADIISMGAMDNDEYFELWSLQMYRFRLIHSSLVSESLRCRLIYNLPTPLDSYYKPYKWTASRRLSYAFAIQTLAGLCPDVILPALVRNTLTRYLVRILVAVEESAKIRQSTMSIQAPPLPPLWMVTAEQALQLPEVRNSPALVSMARRWMFSLRAPPELLKGTVASPVMRSRLRFAETEEQRRSLVRWTNNEVDMSTPIVFPSQMTNASCRAALEAILDRPDDHEVDVRIAQIGREYVGLTVQDQVTLWSLLDLWYRAADLSVEQSSFRCAVANLLYVLLPHVLQDEGRKAHIERMAYRLHGDYYDQVVRAAKRVRLALYDAEHGTQPDPEWE